MATLRMGSTTMLTESGGALTVNVSDPTITLGSNTTFSGDAGQKTAKAWCNFEGDGTPTFRDNFNCASVVSGGSAGRYNVTLDTAMGDNGAVVGAVSDDIDAYGGNRGICVANRNTGAGVKLTTFVASTATEGDMSDISLVCFGD
jgi:hypothetical protein